MIDSDGEIAENNEYFVAPISTKTKHDPVFIVPVPPRTMLNGFIICSWLPLVPELAIEMVTSLVLEENEMKLVMAMIRTYQATKRSTRK